MSSISSTRRAALAERTIRRRSVRGRVSAPSFLETAGRGLVRRAVAGLADRRVRLVEDSESAASDPHAWPNGITVRIHHPAFYGAAAFGGSVGLAEAYLDRLWDCDDLPGLIEAVAANEAAMRSLEGRWARLLAPFANAAYRLERNTRAGSRRNIVAHYDLGNEFFSLFLDPTMTYSCAIFEHGATTLEQAQREKIDRACRKLELQPDDHLLEIGAGWGALALHAAGRYGCRVTTTTLSDEQFRYTEARVAAAGLRDRVTVLRQDYRDLTGSFDKLVSIEVLEAVGAERYGDYFAACSRLLKPDGAALIQSIVIRDQNFAQAARRRDFLKKYIFPGSCLPSVAAILDAVHSRTDLRTWHLEDIGPHYATTLRLWREAFLARSGDARRLGYDDRFLRLWDYYLAYCEGAFRARYVGDVQWLFLKPRCQIAPSAPTIAR